MDIVRIDLRNYQPQEFDEKVVKIEAWYDRHCRLWVIQKLNKEGFQIGDAVYLWGKKDAMEYKKELEKEFGL